MVFVSVMMTACSTGRITQGEEFGDINKGMVVFQVKNVPNDDDQIALILRGFDINTTKIISKSQFIRLSTLVSSMAESANGDYFSAKLDPGWYFFESLLRPVRVRPVPMHMEMDCLASGTIAFEVVAGSVSYIGDYDYNQKIGFKGFNLAAAQSYMKNFPKIKAPVVRTRTSFATYSPGGQGMFNHNCTDSASRVAFTPISTD
jgi:hypothetical protein